MNWSNVQAIRWKKEEDGRHRVCYSGSRSLPTPYVGNSCVFLTDDEFRAMYLILRREQKKGISGFGWSCNSNGDVVTATHPRTIQGLDEVEKYFKDEAMKKENDRMKVRLKDLEGRVKELEAIVMELLKATDDAIEIDDL
jgi:hypothetical protein